MEKRRRSRHASPRPKRAFGPSGNLDNVIPHDRSHSNDEIIAKLGGAFLNLSKPNDLDLCRLLMIIERLRKEVGYQEYLDVSNKEQMPIQNNSEIKIKKHWFITEEDIAKSFGMTTRGLRKHKADMVKRINRYLDSQGGTKVPPEEDT
jgi:hypothetical protein